MTSWTDTSAGEISARAREVKPGRMLATAFAAIGVAIGWVLGRGLVAVGWVFGRLFLIGAFFTEAVIYGFRSGAGLPPKAAVEEKSRQ